MPDLTTLLIGPGIVIVFAGLLALYLAVTSLQRRP